MISREVGTQIWGLLENIKTYSRDTTVDLFRIHLHESKFHFPPWNGVQFWVYESSRHTLSLPVLRFYTCNKMPIKEQMNYK